MPKKRKTNSSELSSNYKSFKNYGSQKWYPLEALEIEREKLISPLPRGGRRIGSSAFLSRRPFGYYLPIASYGTIFAAKWSSNGGLEAVVSK